MCFIISMHEIEPKELQYLLLVALELEPALLGSVLHYELHVWFIKLDCLATESAVNTSKNYSNVVQCLCRWYSYFECISLILQVLIERCDTSALYEMPRAVNCHKVMGPELKLLYVFSLVAVLQYIRKIRKKTSS